MSVDAIVTAGSDPEKDVELLAYAGGVPRKALIEVNGKTLLEHVASAILGSGRVRRIAVVGLPPEYRPDLGPEVFFVPDAGGMLENGEAGVEFLKSMGGISERVLVSSSDLPLITPEIVSDLVDLCLSYDADLCFSIVFQEVMEHAFPGSGRTFVSLVDGRFAGGDIHMAKCTVLGSNRGKLHELIGKRKTFWRQVRAVGLDTLFLLLIRRLTIARIERRVGRVLGFVGKAVVYPHPEIAMDVDKPHHLDVVRAAFARRTSAR